ncbi:hypothetical protein [Paraburkholderia sp. J63]|uniref:hypothetical protein n=1 Tax=Paraburkholderia sp. J63 TaxID=2805434 RepID=UPI002ABE06B1|nr:hypothetical protein [Paraburkholderia sp. J63]
MKNINRHIPARLVVTVFAACVALSVPPLANAVGRGGGGGHVARERPAGGGGGGARANRPAMNNVNADARTRNVRNTSVNNVNVNRNVNVNANVDRHGGWDDDYHPVATAAAVTAAVSVTSAVVGSIVRSVPSNCVPVNYGGMVYQQCGSTWYQPQGAQYVVVNAPY